MNVRKEIAVGDVVVLNYGNNHRMSVTGVGLRSDGVLVAHCARFEAAKDIFGMAVSGDHRLTTFQLPTICLEVVQRAETPDPVVIHNDPKIH